MHPKSFSSYSIFLLLILAVFLTNCNVTTKTPVQTRASPLSSENLITLTPVITRTKTSTPIPVLPLTHVPTNPTLLVDTITPLPTIPVHERQAYVSDLITNNGGCLLPCWWGIQPGKTTWDEARNFLLSFGANIKLLQDNLYGVTYHNLPNTISGGGVGATIFIDSGLVQTIRTDVFYSLDDVLQVYDQPDEVWIYTDRGIDPKARFILVLFYGEKGFIAVYRGTAEKEAILKVCPNAIGEDQTVWFLWSPPLQLSFEDVGPNALLFTGPSDNRFHRLEEVTNINARQFYDRYRNKENFSDCLSVLIDDQR